MSKEKSAWERLAEEASSPWDWVAAAAGGTIGAVITIATGGADLGSSIAAGALGGVTVRKTASASLEGWRLNRQAQGLRIQIKKKLDSEKAGIEFGVLELKLLLGEIDREVELWNNKVVRKEEFEERIDELTKQYRQIFKDYDGFDMQ